MENPIFALAEKNQKRAKNIIEETNIINIWKSIGAEINLVGSLRMGLLLKHKDIDFHIYTTQLNIHDSFKAIAQLAQSPSITKIEYNNLIDTEEHCIEWHAWYIDKDNDLWQIDMIHILKGSRYDGYFEKCSKVVNLVIDHYDGGYQAGKYLKELGHKKALCLADNFICMDKERIEGFRKAFEHGETYRWEIPKTEKERMRFYEDNYMQLLKSNVTAVFAVSDFYALEFMRFLQGKNIQIPEDIQIIGFDDNMASRESNPSLTTIHQEANLRAKAAIECLEAMRDGAEYKTEIVLPVDLVKRESTRKL